MANLKDIDKSYISDYDKFLYEFDQTHALSESQRQEKKKHARIATLRDGDVEVESPAESES
jgi:hypothetical protein